MTSNYPTTLADKHNFYLTVDASHPLNERTLYWHSLHLGGSLQQYNVSLLRLQSRNAKEVAKRLLVRNQSQSSKSIVKGFVNILLPGNVS